jgi:mono/diheme cytochrome c family protein
MVVPAFAQGGGDPVKGKAAWEAKNCKNCHGANGEGNYAGVRAGDGKTAADWIKQVRTPRQNMPAYSAAQVSDQELTDMVAYMQTLTKPASFTPKTYTAAAGDAPGFALLNQKRCVACHGNAAAFVKSRFTDKGRTVTAADVIKQLRTPAQGMPAYSATQVSDAEAGQIADFLKSLAAAPAAPAAPVALPTAGGEASSLPFVVVALGVAAVGIGAGTLVVARKRN